MAVRRPVTRRPWRLMAWVLLVVAFGFGVFDLYAPAAVLFGASVFAHVISLRKAVRSPSARDGRTPALPHQ